jgi:hypothetical protein
MRDAEVPVGGADGSDLIRLREHEQPGGQRHQFPDEQERQRVVGHHLQAQREQEQVHAGAAGAQPRRVAVA